ncbi:hypothetical protein SEPCBS119000_004570 [Sporothrix epigloea]|uniref:Uncharacterized protein n=1 Tax=Sporothrix epigloea TaxID=1892477 RepID=A0ABP0DSV6_9PEZI
MPFASHLRRFDLGTACCTANVLLNLLGRLPALEHLDLWEFCLVYETRHPLTIWKDILATLARSPLGAQLRQLSLDRVGTSTYDTTYPKMVTTHMAKFNGQDTVDYIAKAEKSMAFWLQNVVVRLIPEAARSGVYDADLDSVDSDEFDYGISADLLSGGMFGYQNDAAQEVDEEHEANGEGEDNGQSLP